MREFSIKDSLLFGWGTFKSRPWLFIGTEIVLFAISFLVQLPGRYTDHMTGATSIALAVIFFVISTGISFLLDMGKTGFYLRAHDAVSEASYNDLWHPKPFWKYAGASILAGLATILGLILLIVPGIIIGIMVCFATYIVIDKGLGPVEAIKHSSELTKGNRWRLFRFGLALLGINILGFIALVVGLLVSIPVSILAVVHVYRNLSVNTVVAEPVVTPVM